MTTDQYLYDTEETNRIRELALGRLREPAAPFFSHQSLVLRIAKALSDHVETNHLGKVAVAPVDVVLDKQRALILQPDVLFISTPRLSIIRDQVWGPPDLVAEVLSPGTESRDRGEKLGWYCRYGVRECWLVDPSRQRVTIFDFAAAPPVFRDSTGAAFLRSTVLPRLSLSIAGLFA